jgi:CubicO group peptidase (beta-lactamase class C family)
MQLLLAASLLFATPLDVAVPRLMRDGDVPGVAIAVIRDRRVTDVRAFGVANAETRAPLARDAVFEAASLGKPVFAYAVMKLVDRGVLSLDRVGGAVTVRMVLTHTTGYPNEVMPGETLRMHFEPGSRFSYSGAGFLELQRVVEARTGKALPQLMRELVFDPLGMRDSAYVSSPRKVYGHTAAGRVNERRRPSIATVATLHTTARDYARFVIALMQEPRMLARQVAVDASGPMCLSPCSGTMSGALAWGLGVGLEGDAFWHWGENHGDTHTFMMGRPDGSGVVVLTNSGNGHSIMPELVAAALGGEHPAFAWMGYESYRAPSRRILRDLLARDSVPAGMLEALDERQINRIGYGLLERKRVALAIAVFRHNAGRFPRSANVHDSLAEALMLAGEHANAIASYRRSLELDPKNANAVAMLQRLGAE